MTSDRSPSGLDARVKDALQAAASTVTAANRPYTAEQFVRRTSPPRRQWPVIALGAAVAVSLAVTVPYGLLHGSSTKPLPAQSPTSDDPPPLTKVPVKPVGRYYAGFDNNLPPDAGNGAKVIFWGVGKEGAEDPAKVQKLPGMSWRSAASSPDGETIYLSRNTTEQTCTSELVKVTFDSGGEPTATPLPHTRVAGKGFSDLTVSPDGKRLAMAVFPMRWGNFCEPVYIQPDLAVVDLTTGTRHTWTQQSTADDGLSGFHHIAWSFDGRHIVFPWPIHGRLDGKAVYRKLEVTAPEGPIATASTAIPRDDSFPHALQLVTMGSRGFPPELAAYLPQGGSRILAEARVSDPDGERVLVELSLKTGKIREVPR